MYGNYHTEIANNLMVVFDKCNNSTSTVMCQSPEKIDEYLEFKYFIGLWNMNKFAQDEFGDNRIIRTAMSYWLPVSSRSRTDYVMDIERSRMQLIDR